MAKKKKVKEPPCPCLRRRALRPDDAFWDKRKHKGDWVEVCIKCDKPHPKKDGPYAHQFREYPVKLTPEEAAAQAQPTDS